MSAVLGRGASFVRGLAIAPLAALALCAVVELAQWLVAREQVAHLGAVYVLATLTSRVYLVSALIALPAWLAYKGGRFKRAGWFALGGSLVGLVAGAAIGVLVAGPAIGGLDLVLEWPAQLATAIIGAASGLLFWLTARPDRLVARDGDVRHPQAPTSLPIGALSIAVLVVGGALTYEARWDARFFAWYQAGDALEPGAQRATVDAYFGGPGLSEPWNEWFSRKRAWTDVPKKCGGSGEPDSVVIYEFDEKTRSIVVFDGNQRMLCAFVDMDPHV